MKPHKQMRKLVPLKHTFHDRVLVISRKIIFDVWCPVKNQVYSTHESVTKCQLCNLRLLHPQNLIHRSVEF